MKVEPNSAKSNPSQKKKQFLIAVLLIGLLVALLTQPDSSEVDDDVTAQTSTTETLTQEPSSQNSKEKEDAASKQIAWLTRSKPRSRVELAAIMDRPLLAKEVVGPAETANRLISKAGLVQAIYGSDGGRAALLGKTIVRRGQPLPTGGHVTRVDSDGVHVSPEPHAIK